jgi:hypothetical protein
MRSVVVCISAVVVFLTCTSKHGNDEADIAAKNNLAADGFDPNTFESFLRLDNYLTDGQIRDEEIQTIDSTCAILVNPTESQFLEMRESYGDELAVITDDNGYFQSNARGILDSASVKMIEAEKRFIRLRGENKKTWVLDIRKEGAPPWNLIIFNRRKEPEIIPAVDLTQNKTLQYFDIVTRKN